MTETKYLIIGNSAGGIAAAEAIRALDDAGTLIIVSDEPYPAYSRILISKYLTGERDLEQTLLRPADFYTKNCINFLPGRKVVKLLLDSRVAQMENGERISFEKLLLATGGNPIMPQMDGLDKKGALSSHCCIFSGSFLRCFGLGLRQESPRRCINAYTPGNEYFTPNSFLRITLTSFPPSVQTSSQSMAPSRIRCLKDISCSGSSLTGLPVWGLGGTAAMPPSR